MASCARSKYTRRLRLADGRKLVLAPLCRIFTLSVTIQHKEHIAQAYMLPGRHAQVRMETVRRHRRPKITKHAPNAPKKMKKKKIRNVITRTLSGNLHGLEMCAKHNAYSATGMRRRNKRKKKLRLVIVERVLRSNQSREQSGTGPRGCCAGTVDRCSAQ